MLDVEKDEKGDAGAMFGPGRPEDVQGKEGGAERIYERRFSTTSMIGAMSLEFRCKERTGPCS